MSDDKIKDVGDILVATGEYVKIVGGLIGDLFEDTDPEPRKKERVRRRRVKSLPSKKD